MESMKGMWKAETMTKKNKGTEKEETEKGRTEEKKPDVQAYK
jgi:hypothetical protein